MGKKRIKTISLASKKEKEERQLVRTGKEHGRLTDMGMVALEEAEKIKEKGTRAEKEVEVLVKKSVKAIKPPKNRSKRYQELRRKVEKGKTYFPAEAVKLLLSLANSKIDETVEIHLSTQKVGLQRKVRLVDKSTKKLKVKSEKLKVMEFKTERKFPLIHFVLGKISLGEEKLLSNLEAFLQAVGPQNIKKATLTSTMSPGIKIKV